MSSYPASYPRRLAEEPARCPSFLLPFGHRHSLLGSSISRWRVGPSLRSAYRSLLKRPDPIGVPTFHTCEMRPGWVPPVSRGRRCTPGRQKIPDRRLPLFCGQPLHPAPTVHPARLAITRHQRRFTQFTRPVCPLPVTPGWSGSPSAFPRASHPAVASDARRGWGQATEHGPGTTQPAWAGPPICESARCVRPRVATSSSRRR